MSDKQDRSIGELFSELANETSLLIRQELALAKVELAAKASIIGRNLGFLVLGGAVAYAAFLALLASLIMALGNVMGWWTAALLVAGLVGIVAAVLISKALVALKKTEVTPRQTIETLKEDEQGAKQQVK